MPTTTPAPRESDRIEAELRRMILELELEPGEMVSERQLMQRCGGGRTPLREACQRLAEQGLLALAPRQGVVIAPLSVFDFVEVMDAMAIAAGPAAALACRRLSAGQMEQLAAITAESEQAGAGGDYARQAALDYEFHALLAEATGNRYLCEYLLRLHRSASRFNLAAWMRDGGAPQSMDEHQRIIAALRERDPAASRAEMLAHIASARQRIVGKLSPPID